MNFECYGNHGSREFCRRCRYRKLCASFRKEPARHDNMQCYRDTMEEHSNPLTSSPSDTEQDVPETMITRYQLARLLRFLEFIPDIAMLKIIIKRLRGAPYSGIADGSGTSRQNAHKRLRQHIMKHSPELAEIFFRH